MLGSLILYLKGMRRMMFQLSGFYSTSMGTETGTHDSENQPHRAAPKGVLNLWSPG